MSGGKYTIYGCSFSRTTPGKSLYKNNTEGITLLQLLLVIELWIGIWKSSKIEHCILVDFSYWTEFFNILAIGQKHFSFCPPPFLHRLINFEIFPGKYFFSSLCRFIYKLGYHFFIYHSYYISKFESVYKKHLFIKIATFFWCNFSIKLSRLQRRNNKFSIILYGRYYLENCKTILFEKVTNHRKYK